jgi:membrane fusion protein, multidrug efflux system
MKFNMRWLAAGVVLVLALGAGGAWWASSRGGESGAGRLPWGAAKPDAKKEIPLEFLPAEVIKPARAALLQTIQFSGPLVAPFQAQVRAKAPGRLLALRVGEGDRVKAGQVLGTQDMADQNSRVNERAAMVASARASLEQAERTHAQNERLSSQSFISTAALDVSGAAVKTAQAQLDAATAALNTTRVALRDGSILAPIAGIVAKRQALPGELLSNEQPVLTIVDLAQLELAGSVATHEVSRLTPGMAVQVQVEGHDTPVAGRIARIAPAADAGTRAIGVTVKLANPQERFRAGQYALASVTLDDREQRLVVPVSAVVSASGQNHVWTLSEGKLWRRAVVLGRKDEAGGRVEVREGLAPDATLVAARFDNLREGSMASVVSSRSAPAAPSASSNR